MGRAAANDPALVANLVKVAGRGSTTDLIKNLDARMEVFEAGDLTFPLSISDAPNCYICCPSTAYIDYGLEETRHFASNPALRSTLKGLIKSCGPLMRATRLDHQVQPNNWLFSTNPVPKITRATATALRDGLLDRFPDRAIVMRSLNDVADQNTITALKAAGFQMLPARQIYLFDPSLDHPPSTDMKNDAKLLARADYSQVDAHTFSAEDWTRAAMLYHMLYIGKYTDLNPQYTPGFLAQAHQIGLLQIMGLRGPDDILDGVLGTFTNGSTMTTPLLGHDTRKPREIGLYRMLCAISQQRAIDNGLFYNRSAGAAAFKRNRNAVAAIEYTAVYVRHLGMTARISTRIVQSVLTRIGVPVMQRYAL